MKKILLFMAFFLSFECYSQITLDFQNSLYGFSVVKLSNTETKYFDNDQWSMNHLNQFSLYNLDGSLYKTISMPPKPDTAAFFPTIFCISRTLFDNDDSNLEYLVAYEWGYAPGGGAAHRNLKVVREDGTILLNEDDASNNYWPPLIYNTEEGTKMILFYYHDSTSIYYQTKIFNLPGTLLTIPHEQMNQPCNPLVYPNPNNGTYSINFKPDNAVEKNVEVLTSEGKLIKSYKTKSSVITINQPDLPEGLYLLNTRSATGSSTSKMIIKK